MITHRPEVADVFRSYASFYLAEYGNSVSQEQRRVIKDIISCRTAALGGHISQCEQCEHKEVYYNSCRNRHCPKCQAAARAKWLEARASDLLDVPYFHLVFTLPKNINSIALQNKKVLYDILFRAVSETLRTISEDPKHLGAHIGYIAFLHTWGQTMNHHPHLHCVVPGGGLSPEGKRWIPSRKDFFLPVRVLSCLFQKKFLAYLKEAYKKGNLFFHGKQQHLKNKISWERFVSSLTNRKWVVYAKPPFGGPEQVLKYLARYTHRVAISNQRLVSLEKNHVSFRWKDYTDQNREKIMTLEAVEFIRRFLLHVIPSGFMHIRHYGFLSNRIRKEKLPLCRKLISRNDSVPQTMATTEAQTVDLSKVSDYPLCPSCKKGRMVIVESLLPVPLWNVLIVPVEVYDTS